MELTKTLVYDAQGIRVEYQSSQKIILQTWEGFVTPDIFRRAIDQTVDFVRRNNVKVVISNTLKQKVVSKADSDYASASLTSMFSNGVLGMVFVMPENAITQLSVKSFASDTVYGDKLHFCSSMGDALRWAASK